MAPGTRILDLGSGSGEMLCTRARDHGISGVGIDMSRLFSEQATLRAKELGVNEHVRFIHADATGYIAEEKFDIAACVGATGLPAASLERSDNWNKVSNHAELCSSANLTGVRRLQRRASPGLRRDFGDRFSFSARARFIFRPARL